jgi:hypothetical protein
VVNDQEPDGITSIEYDDASSANEKAPHGQVLSQGDLPGAIHPGQKTGGLQLQ